MGAERQPGAPSVESAGLRERGPQFHRQETAHVDVGEPVVARGRKHSHAPLAHGVGERGGDAPAVGFVEGLAVRQVDQVAARGLGGDKRAYEPRARLRRLEPLVADLARQDLCARRDAVERRRVLEVRGDDAGDVCAVRAGIRDDRQQVATVIDLHAE